MQFNSNVENNNNITSSNFNTNQECINSSQELFTELNVNELKIVEKKQQQLNEEESNDMNLLNLKNASQEQEQESISHLYPSAPIYPTETPTLHSSPIKILSTPLQGRGIYASEDLAPGTLIDISPVLLLNDEEYYGTKDGGKEGEGKGVEGSVLRGYVFTWRGKEGGMALALGMGSLFNHSVTPNVSFELDLIGYTIHYKTFKLIKKGEELCIFYGHKTRFENEIQVEINCTVMTEEESIWGGLNQLNEGGPLSVKEQKKLDNKIILFEDLDWIKVTDLVNPEDQVLTTFDCWAIEIPAKYVPLALEFCKQNPHGHSSTLHLKRTKPLLGIQRTGSTLLSVLLFPTLNAPDVSLLLSQSSLAFLNLIPFTQPVPSTEPRTVEQGKEWGKIWPVQMWHVVAGSGTAQEKPRGWERAKRDWVERECNRVWKEAVGNGVRGEHPIASHVTETFDSAVHSSTISPTTLAKSHDTRISTSNPFSHSICNLIDAVSTLDRHNLRPSTTSSIPSTTLTIPYLLTNLTIFTSHEPCMLCSMSLLHSRISELYFIKESKGSGGLGSVFAVHEEGGLNHRFEVWKWKKEGNGGIGKGLELELDP